jgi:NDP-sugar pyrophosphorylase family protein
MARQDVLAIVLCGGRGTRLDPLTRSDTKPAVFIGGKYRLIDFSISNCINNVTRQHEDEGVEKFSKPFDKLMETLAQRSAQHLGRES